MSPTKLCGAFVLASAVLCVAIILAHSARPAQAGGVVTECTDAGLTQALAGGGTVTFRCRRPGPSSIVIDNARVITAPTHISGQNAITLIGQGGIFVVRPGGWLELDGVIIADTISGHGAVIANHGILVVRGSAVISNTGRIENWGWMELEDSWVVGNSTEWGTGGGIWNAGTLFIRRSLIAANKAYYSGGGVHNAGSGYVSIESSTFIGNEATARGYFNGDGGGLMNLGIAVITNSTFVSNTAAVGGGMDGGDTTIVNSTIYGNQADWGANIAGRGSMTNTIVSGATNGNCTSSYAHPGSNNLSSDASCTFTGPDNQINTDPQLGPLVYFGAGVPTYSLLPGSPAIGAGTNAGCPAADQRGFARPFGARCDIGAFEWYAPFPYAWYVPIMRQ